MRIEYLLVAVVLLIAAALLRAQFQGAVNEATNPDSEGFRAFPVTTPFIREICRGGGSDCLILPTPDIDY